MSCVTSSEDKSKDETGVSRKKFGRVSKLFNYKVLKTVLLCVILKCEIKKKSTPTLKESTYFVSIETCSQNFSFVLFFLEVFKGLNVMKFLFSPFERSK